MTLNRVESATENDGAQEKQLIETLVTDDPNMPPPRSMTPAPGVPSGPPSPSGSPPLNPQTSLTQLKQQDSHNSQDATVPSPEPKRLMKQPTAPAGASYIGEPGRPHAQSNAPPLPTARERSMPHRSRSISGGVRHSAGWADAPLPRDGKVRGGVRSGGSAFEESRKSKGIVALLSRKKDRGKSPASGKRYPDGVLGKDGARVWLKDQWEVQR